LDRVQHMEWRDRQDVIEDWYLKLDSLVERIEQKIQATGNQDAKLLIVSDHGFADYDYKVNLNKWLIEQGFLSTKQREAPLSLDSADWDNSKAYAIGLNSIYLNQAGREGLGIVLPDQKKAELERLRTAMLDWKGPDGNNVVATAETNEEAFDGPFAQRGPDMLVGYAPGYRASAETGLGKWHNEVIQTNQDHWNADHCINPASVQGVLFSNRDLSNYPNPSYKDIPPMAVGASMKAAEPPEDDGYTEEDRETVEERLKGLGYL